jgi:hypothetical protein
VKHITDAEGRKGLQLTLNREEKHLVHKRNHRPKKTHSWHMLDKYFLGVKNGDKRIDLTNTYDVLYTG